MSSPWCDVSDNVVANSNWICLFISDPKVHWRVQPTAARRSGRFSKMLGALRALHDNASPRTLSANALKGMNSFWIKNRTEDDTGQFSALPMKLSRVLQVVWQEYVNGDGRHSKHLSDILKKVFALTAFALSWIVETIFDNVLMLSCHD